MLFTYHAKDPEGQTVTGSLEALDERSAAGMVRALGYFPMRVVADPKARMGTTEFDTNQSSTPLSQRPLYEQPWIEPERPLSPGRWLVVHLIYPLWNGVSLVDLSMFYRQFAAMFNAGVPITSIMQTLMHQTHNGTLRKCIVAMNAVMQQGGTLSQAMGRFPWIFLDFHRALIVAGETNGDLPSMFLRLSDALEQEAALRASIKQEMFFPWLTLGASFLLPPLVDVVVLGNFRAYFQDAILPMFELLGFAGIVYVLTRLGSQFKLVYDAIVANLPGIGGTVRMISLARFARTLASLYAAGVLVPSAVRYAAAACGNLFLGNRLAQSAAWMEQGRGMTESLAATRAMPPMVLSMMSTGEQTGSVDGMMNKVAEYYESEAAARLSRVAKSLGVAVTILIGIKVLFILLEVYGGITNQILDLGNP